MFNFVPFKLLINVHSKLSKATTIGKTCPGHNQFYFPKEKIIGSWHSNIKKTAKVNFAPHPTLSC